MGRGGGGGDEAPELSRAIVSLNATYSYFLFIYLFIPPTANSMAALDLNAVDERLSEGEDKEYWIHLGTSAGLDKYPGESISFGLLNAPR